MISNFKHTISAKDDLTKYCGLFINVGNDDFI